MKTFKKTTTALALAAGLIPFTAALAQAQAAPQQFSPRQFLEYLVHNRRDSALVSYTAKPDGQPDPSDPVVLHNADQPMPLASTIKIVILAAYAREVAAGRLDPAQTVTVADWERYYLPLLDGGAHPAALESLSIPADEYGFAQDSTRTVPLDTLAGVMIRFSDNAATDWLLERLGPAAIRATIAEAGLRGQQTPLPILGVALSWHNHEQGVLTRARLRRLLRLRPHAYAAQVRRLAAAFQDPAWREAEFRWMLETAADRDAGIEAQAGEALFPKGTVRDYARIMAGVVTNTFVSEEVSRTMRRHLEWPMEIPQIRQGFDAFGNKGGSLASVLTDAYFFLPKAGDFAGQPRVSVVFFRGVRPQIYDQLAAGMGIFCLTLGLDEDLAVQAGRTLARPRR